MAAVFFKGRTEPVYRPRGAGQAPVQTGTCESGSEVIALALNWRPDPDPTNLYQAAESLLIAMVERLCDNSRVEVAIALRKLTQNARGLPPERRYLLEYPRTVLLELLKSPGQRGMQLGDLRVIPAPPTPVSRGREIMTEREAAAAASRKEVETTLRLDREARRRADQLTAREQEEDRRRVEAEGRAARRDAELAIAESERELRAEAARQAYERRLTEQQAYRELMDRRREARIAETEARNARNQAAVDARRQQRIEDRAKREGSSWWPW